MNDDIKYIGKYTNELNDKEKKDFLYLFNTVFGLNYNIHWFNWKYLDNIYGDSYIVLAYDEDDIIGIRSFWRNDIDNILSYQPCDTAVLKEYRGRGIFSQMTKIALKEVEGAFIYNFPNENSLPGNLKLGWEIHKEYHIKSVWNRSKLKDEVKFIEDKYLLWKFYKSPLNKYYYYEIDGQSYLLYKRKNNLYYVLGKFNGENKKYFTKAKAPILFIHVAEKTMIYKIFKKSTTIVSFQGRDKKNIDIPIFKADYF